MSHYIRGLGALLIIWMVHSRTVTGILLQRFLAKYKKDISIHSMVYDMMIQIPTTITVHKLNELLNTR